eukprot:421156_1
MNIFCGLDGIEPLIQTNKCCNNNENNNNQITSVVSTKDCNNNNTLTLNGTGTFTHSVSGYYHWYFDKTAIICIAIAAQTQCMNPTITVLFQQIDYERDDEYLNVSYQFKSNVIGIKCGDADRCSKFFEECPVDNTLLDDIWREETSPYVFYFRNTHYVGTNDCTDEHGNDIDMSVRLTATCNPIPSTCQTFEYVFNVLESEYNGNGKIQMDNGYYNWDETISIKNKQIKLEGMGKHNTVFYHTSTNNTIISCHFRQCYLTFEALTYKTTTTKTALIMINNDGNIIFNNVTFEGQFRFIVLNGGRIEFRDCTFTFINIINNQINKSESLFLIKNAFVNITKCQFQSNAHFHTILHSMNESNVIITDSIFIDNSNNTYLWLSTNSNATLTNTPMYTTNNCGENKCFSFLDTNLYIDNISSTP